MPSTYSPSLRIELVGDGEQDGIWGQTTNNNLGDLVEQAIAGITTVDVTAADVTLTSFNGAEDQARSAVLVVNGSNAVTRNVVIPNVSKTYIVRNNTSQTVGIKTTSGSAYNCTTGTQALVFCNGSNVVLGVNTNTGVGAGAFTTLSASSTVSGAGFTSLFASPPAIGGTAAAAGAFTTLSASGAVSGVGFSNYLASPPAIGGTVAAAGTFTNLKYTGLLTGGTGIIETATISATAATGTIQFDALTQAVLYYTSNASANWTVNVRGNSGTTLNSVMATGQSMSITFLATQGATAYYNNAFTVDGSAVTPKWLGGAAPATGNASGIDAYTYAIIKTGNAAFTVLASQSQFK